MWDPLTLKLDLDKDDKLKALQIYGAKLDYMCQAACLTQTEVFFKCATFFNSIGYSKDIINTKVEGSSTLLLNLKTFYYCEYTDSVQISNFAKCYSMRSYAQEFPILISIVKNVEKLVYLVEFVRSALMHYNYQQKFQEVGLNKRLSFRCGVFSI